LVLLFDLREVRPHRVFRALHRAVIETLKAAQNRLKKRRATTATHHAAGSRYLDDVVR
jgi:23S rRNA maturation-related 3'-5' exoribonuclease YhaM